MTKKEYLQKLDEALSIKELVLVNFVIYYNPDHVDYYIAYHNGEYDWCYDYITSHKDQLVIGNVPDQFQEAAKLQIKNISSLSGDDSDSVSVFDGAESLVMKFTDEDEPLLHVIHSVEGEPSGFGMYLSLHKILSLANELARICYENRLLERASQK